MLFVKIIFLGPPRLGKTTARRRLMGEIADISSTAEPEQPSTGAVESGGNVVVRNISGITALMTPSEWSVMENHTEEACTLLHDHNDNQSHVPSDEGSSKGLHTKKIQMTSDEDSTSSSLKEQGSSDKPHGSTQEVYITASSSRNEKVHSDKSVETVSHPQITSDKDSSLKEREGLDKPQGFPNIPKLFHDAVKSKNWKDIKRLFKDSALLKMEDTGGQPEFMDMLPALTIGPALYLLFCRLIDNLFSRYTVSYLSPTSRESTTPVESSYTVEEVLLTALASILSFKEAHSSEAKEILTSSSRSVAYIVGTHKDMVSEEWIETFDRQLQDSIRSTEFFNEDLIQFFSKERMILAIDNMNGGAKEIKKVREFLEKDIYKHFKKLCIPASWLVFSLLLRDIYKTERIANLNECCQLAQQLNISSKQTKTALWVLHHYAGFLMYFPELPELEDTVICDTQIIYDSVTYLIIDKFNFGSVSKCASEMFRETGQFSLKDIEEATSKVSGNFIPLNKLVKLLEHLNIIALIDQDDSHPSQTKAIHSSKVTYFMPCVLQNASCEELTIDSSCNSYLLTSLMIRYKCGFVPLGIFPAIIAHLVGHSPLKLIKQDIKKNRVQFRYGTDRDKVTLIYRTKYYEIHVEQERPIETPTHEVCGAVRGIIESTMMAVSSHMNYGFSLHYQLSFKCPSHPGEDHLCVVDSKEPTPRKMDCLKNAQPVKMLSQHLVWFGKALADSEGCTSGSNLQPEGDVREFSEDLSSGDLYRYLLFKHVPRKDCDIIKEREISGLCFLELFIKYWESCGVSEPGVIAVMKLQDKIKAVQTTIIPNPSPHVSALDYQAYMSSLSPCVHPLLEQQLDWDHGGVDVDLNEIADHMLDWEDRLSAHLGLTRIDISDIKKIHLYQPSLQRREALKRWRNRCGLHATYGNLLKLCVDARHTECAQVICDILKRKEPHTGVSRVTPSSTVGDNTAHSIDRTSLESPPTESYTTPPASRDVREFSEDLNSGDLYRYLLLKNVPSRDCDIIKEREISGACFLELSIKYWEENCGVSEPGVIVITKLQKKIKATQTTITSNPSPHVPDTLS